MLLKSAGNYSQKVAAPFPARLPLRIVLQIVTHTFAVQTAVGSNCTVCTVFVNIEYDTFASKLSEGSFIHLIRKSKS